MYSPVDHAIVARMLLASGTMTFLCSAPIPSTLRRNALACCLLLAPAITFAAPIDLNTWTAESYPAVSGFPAGSWNVSGDGSSVLQTANGQATFFYSDFSAMGTDVTGTIRVGSSSDDDYIGFALGFNPGDTANSLADYLLIDWKKSTQYYNFGSPSTTPGTDGNVGLAVSRVTGIPTADELWGHTDFDSHPGGEVEELARGTNLGSTGWANHTDYSFRFLFYSHSLQVYVNDVLEIDINGSFSDGRMAFYNFSQNNVTYSAFDVEPAPSVPDHGLPMAWMLALVTLAFAVLKTRLAPSAEAVRMRE